MTLQFCGLFDCTVDFSQNLHHKGDSCNLSLRIFLFCGKSSFQKYPFADISYILYCTNVLFYCAVLYCTLLYSTALYCTLLYCTLLYCLTAKISHLNLSAHGTGKLHTLCHVVLHNCCTTAAWANYLLNTLQCIMVKSAVLHYTALH